jgi:hypothetical protein
MRLGYLAVFLLDADAEIAVVVIHVIVGGGRGKSWRALELDMVLPLCCFLCVALRVCIVCVGSYSTHIRKCTTRYMHQRMRRDGKDEYVIYDQ